MAVGDHRAPVQLDAQGLQVQPLDVGPPAGGEEDLLTGQRVPAAGVLVGDGAVPDLQDLGAELEGHPLFFIGAHQHVADLRVGGSGKLGQHLEDRDRDADAGEITGHFQADDAAADADQGLGQGLELEDLPVGQDEAPFQARLQARHRGQGGHGAGGDDQAAAGEPLLPCQHRKGAVGVPALHRRPRHVDPDAVGFHGALDAGDQSLDHLILPGHYPGMVIGDLVRTDAVVRAVLCGGVLLGAVEQTFRGDAALVQAGSAHPALLHHRGLEAALGSPFGT